MKKLSIEEKAKAYDEAINRIKHYIVDEYGCSRINVADVFPELKESEDEKWIPKEIAKYLKEKGDFRSCWITWLEKQGEQKSVLKFDIGDLVKNTNHCKKPIYRIVGIDKECYICESDDVSLGDKAVMHFAFDNPYLRLVEQKPADKVEPKFKAGDFIADDRRVLLVLANEEERNLGETYSTYCEGLVLDVYGNVLVDGKDFSGFRLATDIERANFVHDLKVGTKINYNPAWSEEDEKMLQNLLECLKNGWTKLPTDVLKYESWLKSLKPHSKQEWSEGDEAAYNKALDAYYYKDCNDKDDVVFALKDLIDLIEKHRKAIPVYQRWKPSDEQMEALRIAYEVGTANESWAMGKLKPLYNDLKNFEK